MKSSGRLTKLTTGPLYFFDQPTRQIKRTRSHILDFNVPQEAPQLEETLSDRETNNKESKEDELPDTPTDEDGEPDTSPGVGAALNTKDDDPTDAYKRAAPWLLNQLAELLSQHEWTVGSYPSGCMAVCQSHSDLPCGGFYTNVFSDSHCPTVLATMTAFGHGAVTHPHSSTITAMWDQDGGFMYDHLGNITKEWRWKADNTLRGKIVIQGGSQMAGEMERLEKSSAQWRRGGHGSRELKSLQQRVRNTVDEWMDYYRSAIGIKCPDTKRLPDAPLRTRLKREVQSAVLPSLNPPEWTDAKLVQLEDGRSELQEMRRHSSAGERGPPDSSMRLPRAALQGDGGRRRCCCSSTRMPVVTDLEYDAFVMGQPPHSQQIMVVCVTHLHQPVKTQAVPDFQKALEQLYRRRNKHRTMPCAQCHTDSIRLVRYEISAGEHSCGVENVLLQQRHNAAPGMVLSVSTNSHLSNPKPLGETLTLDKGLGRNIDVSNPVVNVRPSLPYRTLSDELNGNVIPQSAPGLGREEDAPGSEQISCVPQPKLVPAVPRKPLPVPKPRKPTTAVRALQEKVEEDRQKTLSQKGRETNVREVMASSEGKSSSSLSVSVPANENKQQNFLSARKACAPPARKPKKKPTLSATEKAPTSAAQTLVKDVEEKDLGWDRNIYEMDIQGHEDTEVEKEKDDQEAAYYNITHHTSSSSLLTQPELSQPPAICVAAEENRVAKVTLKKPQRPSHQMDQSQRSKFSEESDRQCDQEKRQVAPLQDFEEAVKRQLDLPPHEKKGRTAEIIKPSLSRLGKQRAKSFSVADLVHAEVQRKNSFWNLLDLKFSVRSSKVKGGDSSDSTANEGEQNVCKDPDKCQNFTEQIRAPRKFSCPIIGVEQSVDGDEFPHEMEEAGYYEDICYYEDIREYMNVQVGTAQPSPWASLSQPTAWDSQLYNDEGIYEEQEPYVCFDKNTGQQQNQTQTSYDSNAVYEDVPPLGEGPLDDDIMPNTSEEEEDEEDGSSTSSKGETEQPEGSTDFRGAVSKASLQSGKPVIEERLLNQILYYLPQLYELNEDLLRELKQRVAKWDDNSQLADIFLKKGPYLKMYSTYIREFEKNVTLLEEQSKRNPAFGVVVQEFEASPRCASLALKHYLLKPVQRIPQYQLLLTDYLKNLHEHSNDYKDTQAALALVKEVANHANDIMKQGDNFQKLIQVQCSLNGQHEVVQPGRIFLKEGTLMKLSRKVMQPRMFFLFNDVLLYTTPVQSGQYKLNNKLSLAGMKVSKPSQEAYQNELTIESVERSFILSASSAIERDEWLKAISTAISDYTKKKISFISAKPPEEVELSDGDDGAPLGTKAPIWIPDPRTTMCMICTCEFSLTWRRHHCRACGKVVCHSCSSNKHRLEYLKNEMARVCDQCFLSLLQQKNERSPSTALSPGNRATFAFSRKQKKIPAALKEVTANTDKPSMSGYLQRSKGNKKQVKRLWFVIKNKVLYTYAASEDVAALESQPLLGFVLKVNSSQKLQFELYHKNILYYIFKADDVQTAQRWIESFKEATVLE
ncbi:FYVE, RhoGEF and PH domain-containing protein 6 Zinc finger FYVE domain-containing protein 24 [Channa argus]|uniref:FYVE, RhoGEF and PH domain-containing protein 6 Zinc finger FYVE domain-containing protein 24 n=1 Tax=Channa argus TaxID=215402 RepID=A0A6G1PF57_CHAAH|nr:FYVE, RhoGEF and PH domain-containing protein 6 Zinc finger FYVE domain-containing protein 24 [Channa argus]